MTKKIFLFLFYSWIVFPCSYSWAQDSLSNEDSVSNSEQDLLSNEDSVSNSEQDLLFNEDSVSNSTAQEPLFNEDSVFNVEPSSSSLKSPAFNKYPVFNSEVEGFIDNFILSMFVEEVSQLSTQFSDESDFSKGFLKGRFDSRISFPESPDSGFFGGFLFYIDSQDGGSLEYGLNFKLQAQIQPLDSFLAVIRDKLSSCLSDFNEQKYLQSLCQTKQNSTWDITQSTVSNLSQILYLWKEHFIQQIEHIQDPDLQSFQQEFADWIDQHIVIDQREASVTLSIDFSNLNQAFSGQGRAFLKKTKLVDLSLEALQIQFFEDSLFINLHVKKLHVAKRINLYVELLGQLQSFIEDSERAGKLGQALREDFKNRDFNKIKILKQLSLKEGIYIGSTLGSAFFNSNENKDIISSQTEEDLGLD